MKKIISLAMGITFFTECYGSTATFSTPTKSNPYLPEFGYSTPIKADNPYLSEAAFTSTPVAQRTLKPQPVMSPSEWNSSPLIAVASFLNPIAYEYNQSLPLDEPTPLAEGNESIVGYLNESFQKQKTNHLALMQLIINGEDYFNDPVLFLSGSDNDHIRVNIGGIIGDGITDLTEHVETLGSTGYSSRSPQAHAHSEKAAMLWLINNIDTIVYAIKYKTFGATISSLVVQLKIAHKIVCDNCRCFLLGGGFILEGTHTIVGKSNKDPKKVACNIWSYFPKNTEIQVSNDAGQLLLDIMDGKLIGGSQAKKTH